MNDSKHTPGPWWVDEDGCIAAGSGDDYVTIAQGLAPGDDCGVDEISANLTLMAAAPESLAALEDMTQMVEYLTPEKFDDAEHEQDFNARLVRAREVIQKARSAA